MPLLLAQEQDGELEFAGPAILEPPSHARAEWAVRWGALGKDGFPLAIGRDRHSAIKRRHECAGIEWLLCLFLAHRNTCLPAERAN